MTIESERENAKWRVCLFAKDIFSVTTKSIQLTLLLYRVNYRDVQHISIL